ncbi:MAG: LamG-like jellyroll fold domain-containing protein, partial [Acidobacteriota bacterium]
PVDRWSRVVFVVDRGSASLYVNDAVQSAASAFLTVGSNDNPLVLGAESASAQRFVGSLSNLRMFTAVFGSDLLARLDHQSIPWEIGSRRSNTNHQLPEVDGDVVQFLGQQQATLCATESDAVCSEIFPLFDFRHSGFSFGANVRPDGLPASNALLAGKNDAWRLYYLSTGKVRLRVFGLCGGSACTVDVDSTITLEPGQWNHVAFTVTPESDGTQTPRLFVTADSSETVQGSIDSIGGGSKPLTLGSRWTGTSLIETFSGAISGVRLFFGALSDAEVTQLARAEIDWHIRPPVGTPRIADNVFLFDQAETTADQILLCGPPVKVEGGAPVNCPTGGYEHFDLGDRGFTFTAEVRPDPLAPDLTRIVGKDGSFYIHQRPDRTIRLRVFGKDCGGCFVDLNGPALDNGVYTDITFSTTRRTDGDLDVRLFVEDTQVATEVSAPVGLDEIKPLVLGSHSGGKRFRGALRDVRLFARSLTPNDLLLLGP